MTSLLIRLAIPAAGAALCFAAWAHTVVGSGRVVTEVRPVGEFNAISVRGGLKVEVRQAAAARVEVRGDDNLLPLLETRIERGNLVIRPQHGVELQPRGALLVTVDVVTLKALSAAGATQVAVSGLKTPELTLSIAGSGDATLRGLATQALKLEVSGRGRVDADGSATRLEASIAGSGDLRASRLQSQDVEVSIAGSGDARVAAARRLDVSIAGSGNVRYAGDPVVHHSILGSGRVLRD